jgi:hypothetical protein
MIINIEDFLLVTGEVVWALLEGDEDLKKGAVLILLEIIG